MGQNATVRTLYGKIDSLKIEKGILQGCLLSPCLFNLYAEHIMRNVELDELQVGIKIGGRNVNNLRYSGMIPQEESETAGLKLNTKKKKKNKTKQKTKKKKTDHDIQPHYFMGNTGGKAGNGDRFSVLGHKNQCRW